jgi:cytochrome c oxidase subunit 3
VVEEVHEHFSTAEQQRDADFLGMWTFLATEAMLFGGLFMGITVYRIIHPEVVQEASHHLNMWLGGLNTAVLLTSSLTMALAVAAARDGRRGAVVFDLLLTAGLGVAFLGIKGLEYFLEYQEGLMPGVGPVFPMELPGAQLFFNTYFVATGLHAIHLTLGVMVVGMVMLGAGLGRLRLPDNHLTVEMVGLYWHFVDVVWVFLFPVLYLIGR